MKQKSVFNRYFLAGVIVILSTGCRDSDHVKSDSLDKLNWSEHNYMVLSQLINDYGYGGKCYNEKIQPYAVLDWDQTCAFLDVEEALMRYQLTHLRYKITREQFRNLLKDNINGVTQLSENYQNVRLADINLDLLSDFDFLNEHFWGLNGSLSMEQIQVTPQYNDFLVKIPYLYEGYCETPGIGPDYGYPWLLFLLAGHTLAEVKTMAKETLSYELANRLSRQTWQPAAGFQTNAGALTYSFKSGMRVIPEMQNLISTLKGNGIEVFIVSASFKPVVEVFAGIGTYGYNIPPENVIAMELAIDNDGKILPEYKAGWIQTQRQGKVDAINRIIKQDPGRKGDPVFSAGDSDGDYEMSTQFPDMKLTLIWNRVKGGDIGRLCKQAVEEFNNTRPRYILQGRDENTGMALPCSESILFGKTELQLLYD